MTCIERPALHTELLAGRIIKSKGVQIEMTRIPPGMVVSRFKSLRKSLPGRISGRALLAKPKLYIADIKEVLSLALDRGETYPHHNLYFIESDTLDFDILGGLLMSAVGQFFVESYDVQTRGG